MESTVAELTLPCPLCTSGDLYTLPGLKAHLAGFHNCRDVAIRVHKERLEATGVAYIKGTKCDK